MHDITLMNFKSFLSNLVNITSLNPQITPTAISSPIGIVYSVPSEGAEEVKGETVPYRHADLAKDEKLTDSFPSGDQNLNKAIENAVREYANNPCLGTRVRTEETKVAEDGKEEKGMSVLFKLTFSYHFWKVCL